MRFFSPSIFLTIDNFTVQLQMDTIEFRVDLVLIQPFLLY